MAIDAAVQARGVAVARMDFPYRSAGRRRPDPNPVLEEAVRREAEGLAGRLGTELGRLVLGGRSMGGRICSQVVAAGLPAAGLVLVSYPLHPPGRPDRKRTTHFDRLRAPCLFVSGTRDAFGTPDELEDATRAILGPVTHRWIDGADHGLGRHDATVAGWVADWISVLGAR